MNIKKVVINVGFNISNPLHDQILRSSQEIRDNYGSTWWLDDQQYHLHLSVYLFAAPENNREKIISMSREYVKNIKLTTIISNGLVSNTSGLIMIKFNLTPDIFSLHTTALEMFNPFREGCQREKYEDPENLTNLTPEELKNVRSFGHLYVLEKYTPHITIARVKDEKLKIEILNKYSQMFAKKRTQLSRLQVHEAIFGEDDRTQLLSDLPLS